MNTLHRWAHFFSYQIQIWTSNTFFWVRASVADMLNVLNAIIFGIWHTKQQKWSFIRCVKCIKLLQHVTVPLHFWHGTDNNGIWVYYFFIHLSLSSHFFIWFFLSLLRICLSTNPCSSSSYNRTRVAQKKATIAAKRGGKAATTLSKSAVTAASDSQNGAEKLANGVEALLIFDLSL